ncbi:DUF3859 domain-containing protein [Ferribacterium limneticum]|uniref:DUF3859 domain-containing protein n=1 Tax=Ferribacterium limneticum TaxID=76259 RepID=UPI001CF83DB0|nr:DUF3859 domain-containing protein [Ferribacterium limneticum]UCV21098.1 DUF3859 domain-containing protein [Ferribacterium limneticum]
MRRISVLLTPVAVCLLPVWAVAAVTSAPAFPAGEILSAGICVNGEVIERYDQPQSAAGYANMVATLRITEQTDEIPLRKGIGFGFAWKAKNLPPSATITYRLEHPVLTRPDGRSLDHFEENLRQNTKLGVIETVDCNFLSEEHELVPGTWTLSVIHNGSLLVKR